jgi:hypothetical protein
MEAFFVSAAVVAIAEIGDKTQLLALMLAARYRKPIPIILGIFCATLANHALAAWVGAEVAAWIGADAMRWVLAVTFIVMAGWCLIPDKADDGPQTARQAGAFLATLVAFFLVEIGDKTQIATVALAARFNSLLRESARLARPTRAKSTVATQAYRRNHRVPPGRPPSRAPAAANGQRPSMLTVRADRATAAAPVRLLRPLPVASTSSGRMRKDRHGCIKRSNIWICAPEMEGRDPRRESRA